MFTKGIRRLLAVSLVAHFSRLIIDIESSLVLAQEKETSAHLLQVEGVLRIETSGRLEQRQRLLYATQSSHDLACKKMDPSGPEEHTQLCKA